MNSGGDRASGSTASSPTLPQIRRDAPPDGSATTVRVTGGRAGARLHTSDIHSGGMRASGPVSGRGTADRHTRYRSVVNRRSGGEIDFLCASSDVRKGPVPATWAGRKGNRPVGTLVFHFDPSAGASIARRKRVMALRPAAPRRSATGGFRGSAGGCRRDTGALPRGSPGAISAHTTRPIRIGSGGSKGGYR
ncbi:hypothetical protein SMALB_7791 [Streptomyces malaysiensis]|uniref:Uncharacterized protein n=1 Tax=Streptomyces malaysiensis TaxID=92644 RepID=A0A7X6B1V2_STRMQ|nr:hypothetical protein [Streptomyces malaysiensis]